MVRRCALKTLELLAPQTVLHFNQAFDGNGARAENSCGGMTPVDPYEGSEGRGEDLISRM